MVNTTGKCGFTAGGESERYDCCNAALLARHDKCHQRGVWQVFPVTGPPYIESSAPAIGRRNSDLFCNPCNLPIYTACLHSGGHLQSICVGPVDLLTSSDLHRNLRGKVYGTTHACTIEGLKFEILRHLWQRETRQSVAEYQQLFASSLASISGTDVRSMLSYLTHNWNLLTEPDWRQQGMYTST